MNAVQQLGFNPDEAGTFEISDPFGIEDELAEEDSEIEEHFWQKQPKLGIAAEQLNRKAGNGNARLSNLKMTLPPVTVIFESPEQEKEKPVPKELPKHQAQSAADLLALVQTESQRVLACRTLKKLTEEGVADAQYELARCYFEGKGVQQDGQKAFQLLTKVARSGNVSAQLQVAKHYRCGQFVAQNDTKAVYWLQAAAKQGSIPAMIKLGDCYAHGCGVVQNSFTAARIFKKVAKLGDQRAMKRYNACKDRVADIENGVYKQPAKYSDITDDAIKTYQARTLLDVLVADITQLIDDFVPEMQFRQSRLANLMYQIGINCLRGGVCEQSDSLAMYWFTQAAQLNHTNAMVDLAVCYIRGLCSQHDEAVAFELFRKAARAGNVVALRQIAGCLENGVGCPRNLRLAIAAYEKCVEAQQVTAAINLASLLRRETKYKNVKRVAELLRFAAEKNDAIGLNGYADCLFNGTGVEQDFAAAAHYYEMGARKGNALACANYGYCFEMGLGVQKDEQRATQLYAQAAKFQCAIALRRLGNCFMHGIGVQKYKKHAVDLLMQAQQKGDLEALLSLANYYERRSGTQEQKQKAQNFRKMYDQHIKARDSNIAEFAQEPEISRKTPFELYQRAARVGSAEAQYQLGQCYFTGEGVKQSYDEAARWYAAAAKQEHAAALFELAKCYCNGHGVQKNVKKANSLPNRASQPGNTDVLVFLQKAF